MWFNPGQNCPKSFTFIPMLTSIKRILLVLSGTFMVLTATAQTGYWQQKADYRIDVTLNDKDHSLEGFERINYTNQSPDTLRFIWFHLWPNAYKNDKTAFSEQLLKNGRTDFYFSKEADRGYINRLDFKVNNITAAAEDHPNYIDLVKLMLPNPLPPGGMVTITTPFHVQLPYNFSRGGHVGQAYQITQWYPKPAVYDAKGWHPLPYLDQGEFYSEFGSYEVRITLPANYWVAATGELQNEDEKQALNNYTSKPVQQPAEKEKKQIPKSKKTTASTKNVIKDIFPASAAESKTLVYKQDRIHDFAWFTDKRFVVKHDTLQLASGRTVNCYAFYLPEKDKLWSRATGYIKDALRFRSKYIGEYPYNTATVVDADMGFAGGMEYPTITSIAGKYDEKSLDMVIEHELGHNWFYGILASNERRHPWMDEGMNSYYDNRYEAEKYPAKEMPSKKRKLSLEIGESTLLDIMTAVKKDQPIETPSEKFSEINYVLVAYEKTAQWMALLENKMGHLQLDSMMQAYYNNWQFKHPQPEHFDSLIAQYGGKEAAALSALRKTNGAIPGKLKTNNPRIPAILPLPGLNKYDGIMAGAIIHNYNLPVKNYHYLLAPLYGTRSKQLSGLARLSYNWYPKQTFYRIDAGIAASHFSKDNFKDRRSKVNMSFTKIAPFIRFTLKEKDVASSQNRFIQLKHFNISEEELRFTTVQNPGDTFDLAGKANTHRYVNQLQAGIRNFRALYPYSAVLQIEQTKEIIRSTITANQYFNYNAKDGGLHVRLFAGKISFTGSKTIAKEIAADRYAFNMTGPKGDNDYTYSDYFAGRNEFEGFLPRQIMNRDGAFKFRTDLLASRPGRTSNWLAAINLTSDIPARINPLSVLPVKIPLKLFADIGTYDEAWKKNTGKTRFLFDAGLQLSLFKGILNFYLPLIYSKEFADYSLQINQKKRSFKNMSFSIDLNRLSVRQFIPQIQF
jgi:hypothetical protein